MTVPVSTETGHRLLGRADERGLLDGLLADIRRGRSRSLVLRGEAGIGKTALLKYLIDSASEETVAQTVGVESEMELAFAGLHQLLRADARSAAAASGAAAPGPRGRVRAKLRRRPGSVPRRVGSLEPDVGDGR